MKHLSRVFIIVCAAFYTAYTFIPTITIGVDPKNIFLIIGGLLLISLAINPIFSLILLPVSFLTFGLITLILNVTFVFILIRFLPGFTISPYNFPGAYVEGLILPSVNFNQFTTTVLIAIIITFVQKILHFIFD